MEDLKFKYTILPLQAETTYADLTRLKDCTQVGIKSTTFKVSDDYIPPAPQSYLEIIGGNICMSILKRPENGVKNRVVVRLHNLSDVSSEAEIKCFRGINGVEVVNLNEEYLRSLPFNKNSIPVKLDPWKVHTLSIIMNPL